MYPAPLVNSLLFVGMVGSPDRSPYAPDVATVLNPRLVLALVFCVAVNPCALVSTLNLLPSAVEVVVAKLASSPKAAASSFSVFRASGAVSTMPATSESTYEVVAYPAPLVNSVLLVGMVGLLVRSVYEPEKCDRSDICDSVMLNAAWCWVTELSVMLALGTLAQVTADVRSLPSVVRYVLRSDICDSVIDSAD